jgi:hypothetical protein
VVHFVDITQYEKEKIMLEPIEVLRARLLSNEDVLNAIQMRAYEIWILRGRQFGRNHEDWMLAENEVLNYLIEQEWRKGAEQVSEETDSLVPVDEVVEIVEVEVVATPLDITPEPIPEADVIIEATAPVETSASQKTTKRASTKAATTTRKPKAVKESAEKKPAAKKTTTAKKPATRRTASKKSAKSEQPVVK